MLILISLLLQKPADLDQHCFQYIAYILFQSAFKNSKKYNIVYEQIMQLNLAFILSNILLCLQLQVPGFPAWFNIKYEEDEALYAVELVKDYQAGEAIIIA